MQITHNNKTYRWIGDKWGETFIDEYSIFGQGDMLVYFQYGSDIIKTYHTPEQLVKLGYLEEVKEKNQKESDALFWKPTPGQEIEVSNDGEKWYKYRFSMMSGTAPTIYIVNVDTENGQYACSYRFARPIEDKIELLPPHEFSYDSQTEFEMIVMQRLELLTNALNQLISK